MSELQARRAPGGPRSSSPAERAVVDAEISAASTVTIAAGYASRDFVTDAPAARVVLDDPLVGTALRARRTPKLRPGGRLVLNASVQPFSLRLWRVPASAATVTLRRTGGLRLSVTVHRGSAERALGSAVLRLDRGKGSLLLLVIGGGGGEQAVRLTLTGTT